MPCLWWPAAEPLQRGAMTDSKPFAGKLALVTGASRGIGAATAEALAAAGAHVVLVARAAAALEAVEERIHRAGGSATIAPLDLTEGRVDRQARGRGRPALEIAGYTGAQCGDAGIIDPGAGHRSQGIFAAAQPQRARQPSADRRLRPASAQADRADMVALTSSVGARTTRLLGRLRLVQGGARGIARRYADETAHTGRIRVHIVDPGATRTRMRALAFPGEEPESVKPPEVVAQAIVERLKADAPTGEKVRVEV